MRSRFAAMILCGGMMTPMQRAASGREGAFFLSLQRLLRTTTLPKHQASAFDDKCLRLVRAHLRWIFLQPAGGCARLARGKATLALRRYRFAVAAMRKYLCRKRIMLLCGAISSTPHTHQCRSSSGFIFGASRLSRIELSSRAACGGGSGAVLGSIAYHWPAALAMVADGLAAQ